MSHIKGAFVALVLALLAGQAQAADADSTPDAGAACPQAAPVQKSSRLDGLLAAAGRSGALDMLRGGAPVFGSGKGSAVAGAVLGSALNAAGADAGASGLNPAAMAMGGDRDAQLAAVATGTVIGLARAHAARPAAAPCGAN